jgi:hypothetical protein
VIGGSVVVGVAFGRGGGDGAGRERSHTPRHYLVEASTDLPRYAILCGLLRLAVVLDSAAPVVAPVVLAWAAWARVGLSS